MDALRAQAVVARSYALTTGVGGNGFDHYDDTRSQVYGGVGAETARTNQAVADTSGEVVLYKGKVARDLLLLHLRRHTENNEFSFLGGTPTALPARRPRPLRRAGSPYHRWKRKFSNGQMQAELGGLVRGKLKRIVVTQRGVSPRIVKAKLVGTGGTAKVTGPGLAARSSGCPTPGRRSRRSRTPTHRRGRAAAGSRGRCPGCRTRTRRRG